MDLLKRILNAQLLVTLLAGLSATILRVHDLVPAEVWKDVIQTCLTMFVGGNILKEAVASISSNMSSKKED